MELIGHHIYDPVDTHSPDGIYVALHAEDKNSGQIIVVGIRRATDAAYAKAAAKHFGWGACSIVQTLPLEFTEDVASTDRTRDFHSIIVHRLHG